MNARRSPRDSASANPYAPNSPVGVLLDRVGDKWALTIMGTLDSGPQRFSGLRAAMEGITPKVLTESLRALERDGLITRQAYSEGPARVEYSLTELGETLCPLMHMLRDWAAANIDRVLTARSRYNAARPGARTPQPVAEAGPITAAASGFAKRRQVSLK